MLNTPTSASLALALLLPAVALADMADALDADGDGIVTMSEFNDTMANAGAGVFAEIDTDADGVLSADELDPAEEAGVLPAAATDG